MQNQLIVRNIIGEPEANGLQRVTIDSVTFGEVIGKVPAIQPVQEVQVNGVFKRKFELDGTVLFTSHGLDRETKKFVTKFYMSPTEARARYQPVVKRTGTPVADADFSMLR